MTFSDLDLNPPPRKLRQFSWIWCGVLTGIACWHARHGMTVWTPWLLGAGVAGGLLGTVAPKAMKPAYLGLTLLGFPIGFVVNLIVLSLLWFCIFTPIALFFRLIGRDSLQRAIEPGRSSYWISRPPVASQKRYLRQY